MAMSGTSIIVTITPQSITLLVVTPGAAERADQPAHPR
jgi:hypothetical protein